jgi:hypothetical protein
MVLGLGCHHPLLLEKNNETRWELWFQGMSESTMKSRAFIDGQAD